MPKYVLVVNSPHDVASVIDKIRNSYLSPPPIICAGELGDYPTALEDLKEFLGELEGGKSA